MALQVHVAIVQGGQRGVESEASQEKDWALTEMSKRNKKHFSYFQPEKHLEAGLK